MSSTERVHRPVASGEDLGSDIGRRIRRARKERGMSLAQLGGEDLSRSFLSLVELGKSRISLRALSIVAQRLELPISYFLEGSVSGDASAEIVLDAAEAALLRREPERALRFLQDLAVSHLQRPRYLWLKGYAEMASGNTREALPVLREGTTLVDVESDPHIAAQLNYTLGASLYSTGAFDEALLYLRRALEITHEYLDDPSIMAKITICLGHILYARGDIDGALEHYTRASELFGTLRDLNALGAIYSGLSLAYKRKGEIGNALRYSKLSLGAFEAQHNVLQSARELNNLGVRYLEMGELDRALSSARDAVERARQVGGQEVEALAHSTLAAIYLQAQRQEDAAHEARLAEDLAGENSLARIDAWVVQAALADRAGNTKDADHFYARALEATRATELDGKYADVALAYSLSLKRRGQVDRALEYALEAAQGKPSKSA